MRHSHALFGTAQLIICDRQHDIDLREEDWMLLEGGGKIRPFLKPIFSIFGLLIIKVF